MRSTRNVVFAGALTAALPWLATAATIVVPDDQPTIQAAVDAAAAGDTIQIRPGTYNESVLVQNAAKNGLVIEPAELTLPVVVPPLGTNGFWLKHTDDVEITGIEIHGGTSGVRVDYSTQTRLLGLVIDGATEGVRILNGDHAEVARCLITNSNGRGVRSDSSAAVVVVENAIGNSRREGIRIRNAANAQVTSNDVEDSRGGDGIRMDHVFDARVDLNTVVRSYANGLRIQDAAPGLRSLSANRANDDRGYGIRLENAPPFASPSDVASAGNTATGNKKGDFKVRP